MTLKIGDEKTISIGPLVGLKVRIIGFLPVINGGQQTTTVGPIKTLRCVLMMGRYGWKEGDEIDLSTHEIT